MKLYLLSYLMANVKKLSLNLDDLLWMLLLTEVILENSPWSWWVGSEEMRWALDRQLCCPISWMEGSGDHSAETSSQRPANPRTAGQQTLDGASGEGEDKRVCIL